MFSEKTSLLISRGTVLDHRTTLLIDLTLDEHLQILGERRGVCTEVTLAIQNQR